MSGIKESPKKNLATASLIDAVDSETDASVQVKEEQTITEPQPREAQELQDHVAVENGNGVISSRKSAAEEVQESSSTSASTVSIPATPKISKISTLLGCGSAESLKELLKKSTYATTPRIKDSDKSLLDSYTTNEDERNHKDSNEEKKDDGENDETLKEPMEFSDLSDPLRNVFIVTTAALPWRTGTAINPFLRALYLVKRRLNSGVYDSDKSNIKPIDDDRTDVDGKDETVTNKAEADNKTETEESPVNHEESRKENSNGNSEQNHTNSNNDKTWSDLQPKRNTGKVTLVIPWLENRIQANKLFGQNNSIDKSGKEGQIQQIDWMKNYAKDKCGMEREMNHLHILFYSATYWKAFGSIFPTVDICSLIPSEEADVAILEEPEHLNWFRIPDNQNDKSLSGGNSSDKVKENGKNDVEDEDSGPSPMCGKLSVKNVLQNDDGHTVDGTKVEKDNQNNGEKSCSPEKKDAQETHAELGWTHKFNFVVGIIHTNYSAYMKQYGLGSSIIGAPALGAMSSMVVRAYCHKVIRLSAVIPSYAKWKEVTSNVHGVRGDFLHGGNKDGEQKGENEETKDESSPPSPSKKKEEQFAPIYFIGKLLWAKGFDRMLKVQELFRESNPNREYFAIDVYGGGSDETAILRAFHGRLQNNATTKDNGNDTPKGGDNDTVIETTEVHDVIFSHPHSLRKQLRNLVDKNERDVTKAYSDAMSFINMGFEIVAPEKQDSSTSNHDVVVMERKVLVSDQEENVADPISILSDVSGNFAATGLATTEAMMTIADSAVKTGLAATFSQEETFEENDIELKSQPSFIFDPPKSFFELRRNPIPARFLGVKDHALLRGSPHKIFLNPSVTEVLCTTTAEALAMGKFVIIPDHPSNQFFLQFPNCLAYRNLRECVDKISWALEHEPTPLSEEHSHVFTWEAATDRLIQSSIVTRREAQERDRLGCEKADSRMAWLHSEGGKKSKFIKTLFRKNEEVTDIKK